jgi:hypothetical protein
VRVEREREREIMCVRKEDKERDRRINPTKEIKEKVL